jgi:ornithine cyclodeaminase/alanine dehydrogenase-like protein (mu-crystallin family)
MLAELDLLPADVAIWGRTPARAGILAEEAQHMGAAATVVSSAREAVETAELVVTVTAARVPILEGSWLADDALVAAVGADSEGKRECDGVVMSRAGCLIVDSLRQAASVGELQHAQAEDTVPEHIFELGELLALNKPIHEGIRVCDFTGLGMHDAAVANMVLSKVLAPHSGDSGLISSLVDGAATP